VAKARMLSRGVAAAMHNPDLGGVAASASLGLNAHLLD
jgi:hypothetical protein